MFNALVNEGPNPACDAVRVQAQLGEDFFARTVFHKTIRNSEAKNGGDMTHVGVHGLKDG
jgi:hypothetical protein